MFVYSFQFCRLSAVRTKVFNYLLVTLFAIRHLFFFSTLIKVCSHYSLQFKNTPIAYTNQIQKHNRFKGCETLVKSANEHYLVKFQFYNEAERNNDGEIESNWIYPKRRKKIRNFNLTQINLVLWL